MDMPGPPTEPIDRVLAVKDGKSRVFADKLWCVKGLEWVDGTLFVVHAPFLSALRDRDGDGKADERVDLMTGLGPEPAGIRRIERLHRLRNPPRHGRVPLYRGRPQGNSPRRGQGRPRHSAFRRRRHPDQARRNRPRSRLDRRMQPAAGRAFRNRRDLHLRHRRRQQEMAQQPDPSHRRRATMGFPTSS